MGAVQPWMHEGDSAMSGSWGGLAGASSAGLQNVTYTVSNASPSSIYNAAQLRQ